MKTTIIKTSIFISIVITLSISNLQAQLYTNNQEQTVNQQIFMGFGISMNEFGLGGGAEFQLTNKLSVFANVGLGGWGYKIGGGLSIYPKGEPYGSGFSIGYAHATGQKDFETELEIEPNDAKQEVLLDLNQVGTVNLCYSYYFKIGRGHKLGLTSGYAIPVTPEAYTVKSSGVVLNEFSKQFIEIMQPGGLILGIKFMFVM